MRKNILIVSFEMKKETNYLINFYFFTDDKERRKLKQRCVLSTTFGVHLPWLSLGQRKSENVKVFFHVMKWNGFSVILIDKAMKIWKEKYFSDVSQLNSLAQKKCVGFVASGEQDSIIFSISHIVFVLVIFFFCVVLRPKRFLSSVIKTFDKLIFHWIIW